MTNANSRLRLSLAVVAIVAVARGAVAADDGNPPKTAYLHYCSACHGETGKGDGVVSQLMTPKPTDLTQIAKQNKGKFPFTRMVRVIDGRQTVRAHGDPAMPVWGEIFRAENGMTLAQQAEVRGKAMLIAEYLRAIQEK